MRMAKPDRVDARRLVTPVMRRRDADEHDIRSSLRERPPQSRDAAVLATTLISASVRTASKPSRNSGESSAITAVVISLHPLPASCLSDSAHLGTDGVQAISCAMRHVTRGPACVR